MHGDMKIRGITLDSMKNPCVYRHIKPTVKPTPCSIDRKCLFSPSLYYHLKLQVRTQHELLIQGKLLCENTAEMLDRT